MKTLKQQILESFRTTNEGVIDRIKSLFNRNGKQNKNIGNNQSKPVKIPAWLEEDIRHGMKDGWIIGNDNRKYGCSQENVLDLFLDDDVSADMIFQAIANASGKGIDFKYNTIKDIESGNPGLVIYVDGTVKSSGNSSTKIPAWLEEDVRHGMKEGWIVGDDNRRYGFSEENVYFLFCPDTDANTVTAAIANAKSKGLDFKYRTIKELETAGLIVYMG